MKAVISREYDNVQTRGRFVVFDGTKIKLQVLTLELPWNNNQIKRSCIREGIYYTAKIYSAKFGLCFLLYDVPDRSAIEIHAGNYASLIGETDTEGCILPGMAYHDINYDGITDIVQSRYALDKMMNVLPNEFELYII